MSLVAIIGGTGLTQLENLEITHKEMVNSPYGVPSGPLTFGKICGLDVVFLARHGYRHTIPPHMVNYRANLWALKEVGVSKIIAVAAVGGITSNMQPEAIVIPDQIIDYTYGDRKSTRLNSSHRCISYAVFCLKKKTIFMVVIITICIFTGFISSTA